MRCLPTGASAGMQPTNAGSRIIAISYSAGDGLYWHD
jgi:hypothetical protein